MQLCPITNGPEKYFAVEFKDELELSSSKKNVSEYMLKKRRKLQLCDISVVIYLATHAQILTGQGSNTS